MSQLNLAEQAPAEQEQAFIGQFQQDVPKQKQRINIYTIMLVISFFCLLTGTLLLRFELELWGAFPYWP